MKIKMQDVEDKVVIKEMKYYANLIQNEVLHIDTSNPDFMIDTKSIKSFASEIITFANVLEDSKQPTT